MTGTMVDCEQSNFHESGEIHSLACENMHAKIASRKQVRRWEARRLEISRARVSFLTRPTIVIAKIKVERHDATSHAMSRRCTVSIPEMLPATSRATFAK